MTLSLTPGAANKVRSIMDENKLVGHVVRVTVAIDPEAKKLDYELDIVDEIHAQDRTFESAGVKIVTDPRSYLWIKGTTIDFSADAGGFQFNNPMEP